MSLRACKVFERAVLVATVKCLANYESEHWPATYLIKYLQTDREKVPTREYFGSVIEIHFNEGNSKAKVQFWACCLEDHKNGGQHYHLSLKLSAPKKWKKVKERISSKHGIMVHFSDKHDQYIAAYRYLCKRDKDVFHSPNHPDLRNAKSPKTK